MKAAPTVVCARTSLAVPLVDDAREAPGVRGYGLTPHRVGELDGSRHTRGAKAFVHAATGGDPG